MTDPHQPEQSLPVGTIIADRYRLEGLLSRGGTSFVYRATDLSLGRSVAIKVMLQTLIGHAGRFEREARAMSALVHPAVVRIYGLGALPGGRPYLVMEFVPGETLGRRLERAGRLDPHEAADVLAPVAGALVEAHAGGIHHRDVKPENIMIQPMQGGRPVVRVLDFGIAGVGEAQGPRLTRAGQIMGTPEYMAPEQAVGQPSGAPADVWALGVVLQHMLTGSPPFTGGDTPAILYHLVHHAPTPLPEATPAPLATLIADCLRKEPAERPSATEVLGRLEAFGLGGRPPAPAPRTPTALPDLSATVAASPPRPRRLPWVALGLVAGAALGILGGRLLGPTVISAPPAVPSAPDPMAVAELLLDAELGKAAAAWIEARGPEPQPPEWTVRHAVARLQAGYVRPGLAALEPLLRDHPETRAYPRLLPAVLDTLQYRSGGPAVALLAGPLADQARAPLEAMAAEGPTTRARHRAVDALEEAGVAVDAIRLRAWRADLAAKQIPCGGRKAAVAAVVERADRQSASAIGRLLEDAEAVKCVGEEALKAAQAGLTP